MWNFFQKYSRNTETGELIIKKADFQFDDVQDETKTFYEIVYWAYENGITTGTSEEPSLFSLFDTCTRAQFVTFLWRTYAKN